MAVTAARDVAANLLVLAALVGVALAQDPHLDLPIQHPGDYVPPPPTTLTAAVARALEVMPLPPPAPDPPGEDPVDEPPPVFYGEELTSRSASVVFVIDVSGSMASAGHFDSQGTWVAAKERRVDRAKAELTKAVEMLPRAWSFGLIAYDSRVFVWRPALVVADEENKSAARGWIHALEPCDSTGTGPAVVAALALDRTNQCVVLLTDGAPNYPDSRPSWHRTLIRDANWQRATIDVFGIEASSEMRVFCMGVASDAGGSYYDVR